MKSASSPYPKDSAGISFDPVIHQTNRDGSPRTTKTGRYFARGGIAAPRAEARAPRPETHATHVQKAVPHVPPIRLPAPATAAPPTTREPAPVTSPQVALATATIPEKEALASSSDTKRNVERGFLALLCAGVAFVILAPLGRTPQIG